VKGARGAVVKKLLEVIELSSEDRKWVSAVDNQEEQSEAESESESDENEAPSSEDSEGSDIDDWSGTRVFC
jgi:hypothetical protein